MDLTSHRKTRFPAPDQVSGLEIPQKNIIHHRQTRFPGGTELQKILVLEKDGPAMNKTLEEEITAQNPSRLPLTLNRPDATPGKPLPVMVIKTTKGAQEPILRTESPWKTFKALRTLERGGEVTAACTQTVPVGMFAIKKLSSNLLKDFAKFQHENLLSIIEMYRFRGEFFAITDYTAATLKQVIAIPLPLEELHISATCRQGSSSYLFSVFTANISKVFEGMQHLSRFGLAHRTLDSSKVLFTSDGCAKIGR